MSDFDRESQKWYNEVHREAARIMRQDAVDPATAMGRAESIVRRRRENDRVTREEQREKGWLFKVLGIKGSNG